MPQIMTATAPGGPATSPPHLTGAAVEECPNVDRGADSFAREWRRPSGRWREILQNSDAEALWRELYRLVSHHPLVRHNMRGSSPLLEERMDTHSDLVQELFVILLGKNRFEHYLEAGMTDAAIEAEISHIELKNLLSAELRKRYPESYRLARRISELIQASDRFRRLDQRGVEQDAPPRGLAERVYGLSHWPQGKPRRPPSECQHSVEQEVPPRKRDTKMVGRGGDTQLVISNADLEDLIVEVFEAADSPLDVRALRGLVMSRLPLMDVRVVSMSGSREEDPAFFYDHADGGENSEQSLLRREDAREVQRSVDAFLTSLGDAVRGKSKQSERMLDVLWHCYLDSEQMTQLEVAARLGVSDSLVSDYRRRIEGALRRLAFPSLEEARVFELSLRCKICKLRELDNEDFLP